MQSISIPEFQNAQKQVFEKRPLTIKKCFNDLRKEGIVFGAVCLSVSEQDYGKTTGAVPMNFGGRL